MKILLIEDDERITDAIVEYLIDQHYLVEVSHNGQEAWELLDVFSYDLILLDITLPEIDGLTLCKKLRSQGCQTPILMLTARDTIEDRVKGLDAGADDYLLKPFALQELSARVRALLRRGNVSLPPILTWGNLKLDPSSCQVYYHHQLIPLSPKEYSLLEFFLRHENQVFNRSQLLEHLWSYERIPEEATVKAHIRSLRQKLDAVGVPNDLIETVYGLGYRLKAKPN